MTTIQSFRSRFARLAPVIAVGLALSACDILDVNNPNNLTEESIRSPTAAAASCLSENAKSSCVSPMTV